MKLHGASPWHLGGEVAEPEVETEHETPRGRPVVSGRSRRYGLASPCHGGYLVRGVRAQPYTLEQLSFAYRYDVYLHWQTYKRQPLQTKLTVDAVQGLAERFSYHLRRYESDDTEYMILAGLQPTESISALAGKMKGQCSRALRAELKTDAQLFSKGCFACTVGENTSKDVESYLGKQETHHGYDRRTRSPVWTKTYAPDESPLQPAHAYTRLSFHVVLATWRRLGVFTSAEAERIGEVWLRRQNEWQFALRKITVLPDHVHIALHLHPAIAPGDLIVQLMNSAQETAVKAFPEVLIQVGVARLWQPSAYVGSYGDLHSGAIRKYMTNWRQQRGQT